MRKIILTYGIIGGILVSVLMFASISSAGHDFDKGLLIGYTTMVVALSTIFFAVRTYRDKYLGGSIKFSKAFLMGLYITLLASTLYVTWWMVYSHISKRDYMAEYVEYKKAELESSDLPKEEKETELKDLHDAQESYKNPVVRIGYTYFEILPVGLLISLISASFLKRKARMP